jgi:hypothetical protein
MHDDEKRLVEAAESFAGTILQILDGRMHAFEQNLLKHHTTATASAPDPLLTKKQLAARLNIGLRTVTDWMSRRILPYIKLGISMSWRSARAMLLPSFNHQAHQE